METQEKILSVLNDNLSPAELTAFVQEYGQWNEKEFVRLLTDIRNLAAPPTVDLVLTDAGDQTIKVIKEIRGIRSLGLGLKEAKEVMDYAGPNADPFMEDVDPDTAKDIVNRLAGQGATVEMRHE